MLEVNLRSFFPIKNSKTSEKYLEKYTNIFLVKIFTKCNFLTDGRKNEMFGMHIYMFSPHLLKTYFGFTSKFEKNRENRNFSFKNIMQKTFFFSVLMMYLLNALFESKESKRGCKRGTFFFINCQSDIYLYVYTYYYLEFLLIVSVNVKK